MGEFSMDHAEFMVIGACIASILPVDVFSQATVDFLFPVSVLAEGIGASRIGFLVARPSLKQGATSRIII
jgi:ABC-type branched-subunit amino acid transport system permease subunit